MTKQNIYDLSMPALEGWVHAHGLKPYAAIQLIQWLYQKRVHAFAEMTNLSKDARELLENSFELRTAEIVDRSVSTDSSVKFVLRLHDEALIESVLMPQTQRITLCVSSQVGCAMGCRFCKTAEMKLVRNLTQGEIIAQVMVAIRFLESEDPVAAALLAESTCDHVSNLVFMGMGEPLHNLRPVVDSIHLLLEDRAFNFSRRKITVSTSGLAPEIREFAEAVPVKLAVSLNATNDALRTEIMPINKRYDLAELMAACRDYAKIRDGVVTFEYVMLKDVNDTPEHAAELVRLIAHTPCKINLIPFNDYPESPYQRPSEASLIAFHHYLADRDFQVNIRYSKGLDVLAACGQLAVKAS